MTEIPFERQLDSKNQRTCGAAALSMVYRSIGVEIPQIAIWRVISVPDSQGSRFARTYKMAFDVRQRGFQAIAFKAIDPIKTVQAILEYDSIYVIMNHRLHEESDLGHFTVAISANEEIIEFHDPEYGPAQTQSTATMRALWQPKSQSGEITGNFLIAVAQGPIQHLCKTCGSSIIELIQCPACMLDFTLQPTSALGCVNPRCPAKLWEVILCPYCDHTFSLVT